LLFSLIDQTGFDSTWHVLQDDQVTQAFQKIRHIPAGLMPCFNHLIDHGEQRCTVTINECINRGIE
jgi:hypothetical protein